MTDIGDYIDASCACPPLEDTEVRRLAQMTHYGHALVRAWARNRLIESNIRLVVSRAKRYRWSDIPYRDLMQRGVIGLMRAIDLYDAQKGALSTYASWWIDAEIQRMIDNSTSLIRQPVDRRRQALRVARAAQRLTQRYNREPTPSEIQKETGVSRQHLTRIKMTGHTLSLDEALNDDADGALLALIEDDTNVEGAAEVALLWDTVLEHVSELAEQSEQYPTVLIEHYLRGRTLDEISAEWGCSRQYVSTVKTRAVALLRYLCRRDGERDALEETWHTRDCALHNAAPGFVIRLGRLVNT